LKTKKKILPDKLCIHPLKRCGRWLCRLVLLAVLLLAATLAWLTWFGLPRPLVDGLRTRAARDGIFIDADRIGFDPTRGFVGEGWSWYLHETDTAPLIEVDKIVLEISWRDTFDTDKWVQGLSFSRARLFEDMGKASGQEPRNCIIDEMNGYMDFEPGRIRVRSLAGTFCHVTVKGQGEIIQRVRKPKAKDPTRPPRERGSVINLEGMQSTLKKMREVATELQAVSYSKRPSAEFNFRVDENEKANNRLALHARSNGKCSVRGKAYDELTLDLKMENQVVHLERYRMLQDAQMLQLSGTLRLEEDRVDAKLYADLDGERLFSLMPETMRRYFARQGYTCQGGMTVDLAFVDAPAKSMTDSVSGWITFDQGTYRTMPIQEMRFHLDRQAPRLVVDKIEAVFGEGAAAGPVTGRYTRNDEAHTYTGAFKTGFLPRILLPAVDKGMARTICFADFTGANPKIDIRLSGSDEDDSAFWSEVQLVSTDALYKEVEFQAMELHASYSNQVLHIDRLNLQRPEGVVTGRVHHLYREGMAFLDLDSSIDPAALARVIGPPAVKLVNPVKFIGNARLIVHGMVDFDQGFRHSMHGRLQVEDAWFKQYHIRAADFYWTATSNIFTVADFSGQVSGGELGGFFQVTGLHDRKGQMFHLRVNGKNVDMKQVALRDERAREKPYSGRLSGDLILSGLFNDEGNNSYAGNGEIKISQGELFKFPIFGGLSQFLSKIIPGFGYSMQSDFTAPFTVINRQLSSDNISLKGNLLTMTGHGSLSFDRKLNFKVQIRLLKEGLVAEALQLITWPVSKLLEFKLGGTTDAPDWRPDNLPKELFLIFD
jgi:hypothetical protein